MVVNDISYTAQDCFIRYLENKPDSVEAWSSLGVTIPDGDEVTVSGVNYTCQDCYIRALEIDCEGEDDWHNLGQAIPDGATAMVGGVAYTAQDCFIRALEINPETATWSDLGGTISDDDEVTVSGVACTRHVCHMYAVVIDPDEDTSESDIAKLLAEGAVAMRRTHSKNTCEGAAQRTSTSQLTATEETLIAILRSFPNDSSIVDCGFPSTIAMSGFALNLGEVTSFIAGWKQPQSTTFTGSKRPGSKRSREGDSPNVSSPQQPLVLDLRSPSLGCHTGGSVPPQCYCYTCTRHAAGGLLQLANLSSEAASEALLAVHNLAQLVSLNRALRILSDSKGPQESRSAVTAALRSLVATT